MRIAHISDSHFDERNRLSDTVAVHEAFLKQVEQEGVDLIVHAGDWFERRSSPKERIAVCDFLSHAQQIAPLVGVRGNHDAPEDLELFNRVHPDEVYYSGKIAERPGMVLGVGYHVYCLPWFDKRYLVGQLDAAASAEDSRQAGVRAAEVLLEGIGREILQAKSVKGEPVILLAHCMVSGSETSTGQTLQGVGLDLSPSSLYDLGADYVALGHVHKAQDWYAGTVCYSGSPSPQNFGEPEQKGWRLVTIENGVTLSEFRPLPARKMLLAEYGYEEDGLPAVDCDEALVRVRVRVPEAHLAAFDPAEWAQKFPGAHEVKVEPVVVRATRARAPEISTQEDVWAKVSTFLDAKSVEVDRDRLQAKLGELEAS